eukprot:CAMPEP_0184706396 /NCGR_PEP_ID=MMETSP0313-20130426/36739_1 /TAXON_ID=2792 /ORGANISM="Porphyridium aerugineum, Strain SAG 1380-2" /LENGTH=506 /DNA_ID=CAMNT_0027167949 /DNA_START=376 /DNA_END=1896 /DNA_ORIENTATION=+
MGSCMSSEKKPDAGGIDKKASKGSTLNKQPSGNPPPRPPNAKGPPPPNARGPPPRGGGPPQVNFNMGGPQGAVLEDDDDDSDFEGHAPGLCPKCKMDITGEEKIKNAYGASWHPTCFTCPVCDGDMRREDPIVKGGFPYHEHCYNKEFGATCPVCEQIIVGEAMKALDKNFHCECFVCDVCKRPLEGQIHYENGHLYCNPDYIDTFKPRCSLCEKPIEGFFILALEQKFHKDCFVCENCKKPLEEFVEVDGYAFCELCDPNSKDFVCAICDLPLAGKTYEKNLWGETYCVEHDGLFPKCESCGTMSCQIPDPGAQVLCKHCRENTEIDAEKAKEICQRVVADLAKVGLEIKDPPPVRLATQAQINELCIKTHKGYSSCTKFSGKRPVEILVRRGMVLEEIESSIAHELGHFYLYVRGFPQLKPMVEEGVCETFRAKFLEQQMEIDPKFGFGPQMRADAMERKKKIAENSNMIFGGGYRGLADAMKSERKTFAQALDIIYETKWFPR